MPLERIVVYTGPGCKACAVVKKWLEEHHKPYEEFDVTKVDRRKINWVTALPTTVVSSVSVDKVYDQRIIQGTRMRELEQAIRWAERR